MPATTYARQTRPSPSRTGRSCPRYRSAPGCHPSTRRRCARPDSTAQLQMARNPEERELASAAQLIVMGLHGKQHRPSPRDIAAELRNIGPAGSLHRVDRSRHEILEGADCAASSERAPRQCQSAADDCRSRKSSSCCRFRKSDVCGRPMQQRALPVSPDIPAAELDGLIDGTHAACIRLGDRGGYPTRSCLATSCTKPVSIAADHRSTAKPAVRRGAKYMREMSERNWGNPQTRRICYCSGRRRHCPPRPSHPNWREPRRPNRLRRLHQVVKQ